MPARIDFSIPKRLLADYRSGRATAEELARRLGVSPATLLRRLTARDVRYSFERLLLNQRSGSRWLISPIRGAKRLLDGAATDLEGFHIVSPAEFFIDLETPVSFCPAVLSNVSAAIVPEGTGAIGPSLREGAVGTGPFRLVGFDTGRRLELERNPHYWREGHPKSEGIVFRFGVSPEEIRNEFLAGRFSLASDLLPADNTYEHGFDNNAQRRGAAPETGPGGRRRRIHTPDSGTPGRPGAWAHPAGASRLFGCRPELGAGIRRRCALGQLCGSNGVARDDRAFGCGPHRLLRRVLGLRS